jgi:ubiquinone/menaquinone biosynthesis C-methylase UbiE
MDVEEGKVKAAIESQGSSAADVGEAEFSYFRVQSHWGATKHMGGYPATQELLQMCRISPGKRILEVGCGVGVTAWRLVKEYGCYVVGVDLSAEMIAWSKKRAEREGVLAQTEFRVADAEQLPFEDQDFDIVLCESVTAFPEKKQRAVNEYARVTKPGGHVGINEGTWLSYPPPQDLVQYIADTMEKAEFLSPEGWQKLLETAGLDDIHSKIYKLSMLEQWRNQMGGLSSGDRRDTLRAFREFISLYFRDPQFRKYARKITPSGSTLRQFFKYIGYGLYVGRKV